jgi:hypothetical protein
LQGQETFHQQGPIWVTEMELRSSSLALDLIATEQASVIGMSAGDEEGRGMTETTAAEQRGRPFASGQSGNPAGRPKGARHKALLALDAIGEQGAADVLRKVVEEAKAGDLRAAEILLRRLWPERKGRSIELDLPALKTPADLVKATAAIAEAVASGEVTPEEGQAVAAVIDMHRRVIETEDLAARIAALEAREGDR